jgi:hypothetical protein
MFALSNRDKNPQLIKRHTALLQARARSCSPSSLELWPSMALRLDRFI